MQPLRMIQGSWCWRRSVARGNHINAPLYLSTATRCCASTSSSSSSSSFDVNRLPPHLQSQFDHGTNRRTLHHLLARQQQQQQRSADGCCVVVLPTWVHVVSWKCTCCGCTWSARPVDRLDAQVAAQHDCPACRQQQSSTGEDVSACSAANNTKTASSSSSQLLYKSYPMIAAQWDAHRNTLPHNRVCMSLEEAPTHSPANVWWRCTLCRRPWAETIISRISRYEALKEGYAASRSSATTSSSSRECDVPVPLCPSCERRGAQDRINNTNNIMAKPPSPRMLADDPALMAEARLRPHQDPHAMHLHSDEMVHWECRHCQCVFSATLANRHLRHERCPQCSGVRASPTNLLVLQRPDVVKEISRTVSRTLVKKLSIHDHMRVVFVCRRCVSPYRMSVRARCAVPRGSPACPKCFLTENDVLKEEERRGGRSSASKRVQQKLRRKAMKLSSSRITTERMAITDNSLRQRDGLLHN